MGGLVFLTPVGAVAGVAFAVVILAWLRRERAAARARATLGLAPPARLRRIARPLALMLLGALVAATAAQPAIRRSDGAPMRTDAEIYLTFDVTRSMLARATPEAVDRLERARALGLELHAGLLDFPTGVATLSNRMMPLLFPTADARGVEAVLRRSLRILQPQPAKLTAARATQVGVLTLAADRSYFNPQARRRALVVFTDLDTDFFSLTATLRLLRNHRIEPFVVRVARRGEAVFRRDGRPLTYRPDSTVSVASLRQAGWHAFTEDDATEIVTAVRAYLGAGATGTSGVVRTQHNLAAYVGALASLLTLALVWPTLALLTPSRRAPRAA
ncbi:MAG: hypothetical protein U0R50_10640 [Gaiellales bacterium]